MAYTKAGGEAVRRYVEKNYARISVTIPKAQEDAVKAHASSKGQSVNGLVNALLRADMGLTEDEWKQAPEDAKKAPRVDTEP